MKLLFIFLLSASFSGIAQTIATDFPPPFDWSNWDHFYGDNAGKEKYLSLFQFNTDSLLDSTQRPDMIRAFKLIDLDGDTNPDLIIDGYDLPNPTNEMYFFLLKHDTSFAIFKTNQLITKIERIYPNGPVYFNAVSIDCCKDNEYELTTFQPFITNNHITFRSTRTEIRHKDSDYISQRFPPVGIMVKSDKTPLVLAPSSKEIIKYFPIGSIGYACASKVDSIGQIWWQVFIVEKDLKLRLGWIQKSYLNRNPGN